MFETIFNTATVNTAISLTSAILTIIVSFFLGALISLTYMKTCNKGGYSQNFSLTLVLVPAVISIIILLIGSSVREIPLRSCLK